MRDADQASAEARRYNREDLVASDTFVHAQDLRRVATSIEGSGKLLSGTGQNRQATLAPAAGPGAGWAATGAARSAATSWGGFLNRLTSTVNGVASSMTAAANSSTAADANAARPIHTCK